MQLTLVIPSHNQHWDAMKGILGRRSAENNTCLLETWVFSCFRRKLAGEKLSAAENFRPVQLLPCQCSYAKNKRILQMRS